METYYFLLLVPVIIALVARTVFKHTINWKEMFIQAGSIMVIVSVIWFIGSYGQMADFQILNGEVLSKHRDQGSYVRSYQCNCYTTCDSDGNCTEHCSTCYEDHYTVKWWLKTNIGGIRLQYLDRTSKSVYKVPDPKQYVSAYIGEPCSISSSFTNYIKAVPESLFNMVTENEFLEFNGLFPPYPSVYGYYKVNRVLPMGVEIPVKEWNSYLNEKVKKLGPAKQANVILVVVNTNNQRYRYALEDKWLGGKKNDIIVIIGSSNYPTIDWADTITLGRNEGNSLMTVEMRDSIMNIGSLEDHKVIIDSIDTVITERFDRKPMADYEYLRDSIEPPEWVILMAFIVAIILSIILTVVFHIQEF